MSTEIKEFQHPNSIWTWSTGVRRSKASLWIPYLQKVEKTSGKWQFEYNGGTVIIDLQRVDTILLYGATGALPLCFLDDLAKHRIPLLVHRRNLTDPYVFLPGYRNDDKDVLTAQIRARENDNKRAYVARTLIRERFRSIEKRCPVASTFYRDIASCRRIELLRNHEAHQAARYWEAFFSLCGAPDDHRRSDGPIQAALNAGSFFIYGVLLRWTLLHKLSPAHGFLHINPAYPGLVYDLMEPYRYIIEDSTMQAVNDGAKDLTAATLANVKKSLESYVYVPACHANVRRKNLLHGIVLALRAWLLSEMARFFIPVEGDKKGGRPPKVSYAIPGARQTL